MSIHVVHQNYQLYQISWRHFNVMKNHPLGQLKPWYSMRNNNPWGAPRGSNSFFQGCQSCGKGADRVLKIPWSSCSSQVWSIWVRNTCRLFVKTNPFTKMEWYCLRSRWLCFHFGFRKNGNEWFFMYTCGQTLGHRPTPKITEYENGHTIQWHLETVDLSTWKQLCREATSSNHS